MIIALSGWRGHEPRRHVDPHTDRAIRVAAFDVMHALLVAFPHAQYRVGDCPEGWDFHVRDIWEKQTLDGVWEYGQPPTGCRGLHVFNADWDKYGHRAGPIRNGKMLAGDGPREPDPYGTADLLVYMPQPGDRRRGSGTWDCFDQARSLDITTVAVPMHVANKRRRLPMLAGRS